MAKTVILSGKGDHQDFVSHNRISLNKSGSLALLTVQAAAEACMQDDRQESRSPRDGTQAGLAGVRSAAAFFRFLLLWLAVRSMSSSLVGGPSSRS